MDHNSSIRSGFSPSPPPNVVSSHVLTDEAIDQIRDKLLDWDGVPNPEVLREILQPLFSPPAPDVVDQLRCHERPKSEYQCDRNEADHHKDASEATATFTRKEHDVHSANNGEDEQKRHSTPGAYEPILGAAATTSPSTDVEAFNPAHGSKATADQMAAVMLLHGTPEQKREALNLPPQSKGDQP
ncbi:hypothetical protein [Neorhizobium galegae]|uniref:hypothetical protein n=1 Tax=Neorhizobium galegae TaxID=399 RepID=UPI003AF17326